MEAGGGYGRAGRALRSALVAVAQDLDQAAPRDEVTEDDVDAVPPSVVHPFRGHRVAPGRRVLHGVEHRCRRQLRLQGPELAEAGVSGHLILELALQRRHAGGVGPLAVLVDARKHSGPI